MASTYEPEQIVAEDLRNETVKPFGARSLTWSGLILIYVAVAAFAAVAYYSWLLRLVHRPNLDQYTPELLGCGIGVFAALLGVKLVRAGGTSPSDPLPVVNPKEWRMLGAAITANRDDPIGEYIRLSSLTGATGFFRKLDLSGLPLATIGLTLFFAIASLFPTAQHFEELTQLALGAFIGSFVQKQVGAVKDAYATTGPASHTSGSTPDSDVSAAGAHTSHTGHGFR
jgi:hypothetical protein